MAKFIKFFGVLLTFVSVWAGAQAPGTDVPPAKPRTYALVAAIGDKFTYVRQKQGTGSHLDPITRQQVNVMDNALNLSALRGLDKALNETEPESKRVFLSLNAAEMDGVLPQDREKVAIGKVVAALEKMPQRADWDKILVVTPSFRYSEFNGMGGKLHGFGVYSQPLYSGSLGSGDSTDTNFELQGESEVVTPENESTRSKRYVAPFSYMDLYVLDARTMLVLEKRERFDNQKLFDPKSTAIDVDNTITREHLAARLEALVERSVGRALKQTEIGTKVEMGELKQVKPDSKK
jgi:hypothetical protein